MHADKDKLKWTAEQLSEAMRNLEQNGIIYAEKNEAGEIVWKLTEKGFAMEAAKNKKPS